MPNNTARNIRLIARREYRARVYKRSFAIATIFMLVLALAVGFVPLIINAINNANSQTHVVVLDRAGQVAGLDADGLVTYLSQSLNTPAQTTTGSASASTASTKPPFSITKATTDDPAALEAQVKDGTLESVLVVERDASKEAIFTYTTKNDTDGNSTIQLRQAVNGLAASDRLARQGLNPAQQKQAFAPAQFSVTSTSTSTFNNNSRTTAENVAGYFISFALVVLLFGTVNAYGNWIAQGVVEEKSSRVMEIMVNAARPSELLFGKILGIGGAGLTQFGLFAIAGIIGSLIQKPISQAIFGQSGSLVDLSGATVTLLLAFVLFFLFGFALYSTLYAGLASLVSRQEDVQSALSPLIFLNMAGYIATIFGLQYVNETWVRVLSFVPFFSPILMIARIGVGHVEAWEVVLALAIMAVTTFVMTLLAARIYRNGILLYGQKPRLLSVLRQSSTARGTQHAAEAPSGSRA